MTCALFYTASTMLLENLRGRIGTVPVVVGCLVLVGLIVAAVRCAKNNRESS